MVKTAKRAEILEVIVLFFVGIAVLLLPFGYSHRQSTGFIRLDYYLIWLLGSICWLYTVVSKSKLPSAYNYCFLAIIGVLFLRCFAVSPFDENSVYALVTGVSLIGILICLFSLYASRFFPLVFIFLLLSFCIQTSFGLMDAVSNNWHSLSIKGFLFNSGYYSNYLISILPIFIGFILMKHRAVQTVSPVIIFAIACSIVLMFVTEARAAILGLIIGLMFFYSRYKKARFSLTKTIFGSITLIIGIIGLYYWKPTSASGRIDIYSIAIKMFKDHPLIGIGTNRFAAEYNNYQSEYFRYSDRNIAQQLNADNTFESFNWLLQIAVEYGVVGLGVLLICTFILLRGNTREESHDTKLLRICCTVCLISVGISGLFSNPFHCLPILLNTIIALSFVITVKPVKPKVNQGMHFLFYCIIWGVGCFFVGRYTTRQLKAEMEWEKAAIIAKFDSFESADLLYRAAYKQLTTNGEFLFNYGAEAYVGNEYTLAIKLLEEAKKYNSYSNLYIFLGDAYLATMNFEKAESNYLSGLYISPSKLVPKYKLAQLYKRWNKPDKMDYWIQVALSYPVKVRSELGDELIRDLKSGEF